VRDVEERTEAVLAGLPSYVWDGERLPVPVEDFAGSGFDLLVRDVAALGATFHSSIAATERRIASLF
jgi:hypothetical protein